MTELFVLRRLKQRDRKAFEYIYHRYVRLIFHIIYELIGNYEDASDLTQDTFVLLMEHLDNIDVSRNIKYYLIATSKNLAYHYLLKTNQTKTVPLDNYDIADEPVKHLKDFAVLLKQFRNVLSEEEIRIFYYRFKFNLHFKDIAIIMGISINSVSSKFTRAKNKIKKKSSIDDFYE